MGVGWTDCDESLRDWVLGICERLRGELGRNLVGIYLHGSLASGSYYPPKSDVDLLIVVEDPLGAHARRQLATTLARAHQARPIVGGLECTAVLRRVALRPVHPMPFEVHVSEEWADDILGDRADFRASRTDPDLAAHVQAVLEFGLALSGPPARSVFEPFPRAAFLDSIAGDLDWIVEAENILESPFYGVLNVARVLWVLEGASDRLVPSKEEAAEWLLGSAPAKHREIIRMALDVYRDGSAVSPDQRRTGGRAWPRGPLLEFRTWARERANRHRGRASE